MPTKLVSLIAHDFECSERAVRRAVDYHRYARRGAQGSQLATKRLLREEEDKAVELETERPGDKELDREPFSQKTAAYAAGFVGVYRRPRPPRGMYYHAYTGRVEDSLASIGYYSSVLDAARGRAQRISALATQAPTRTSTRIKKKAKLYHSRA